MRTHPLHLLLFQSSHVTGGRKLAGESAWPGVVLISLALCCDALVANLEEAWFFRVAQPSSQAEVAAGLSAISAGYALVITMVTGALLRSHLLAILARLLRQLVACAHEQ